MSLVPPHSRIAVRPTVQVFRLAAGDLVLHTGGDEFIVPDLPPDQQAALADLLTGVNTPGDCWGAFSAEDLDEVLAVLAAEGIVDLDQRGPDRVPAPRDPPGVAAVDGVGQLAAAVTDLLVRSGLRVLPVSAGAAPPADADVLVACAGWLPDRHWQLLDRVCEQRGLPWHRAHRDGGHVWAGPFTVPGDTAGYVDTRRRQLAATDAPELLEGLWDHLDNSEDRTDLEWPDEGALALVAGVLVSDVVVHLRDGAAPSCGHQLELDLMTRRWAAHPVLPVPRDLMTEPIP